MPDKKIEYTDKAAETIANIGNHCSLIGQTFGVDSEEYVKALQSAVHVLTNLFRFPGTLHSDGELDLVSNSFMTVGIVFHRNGKPICKTCRKYGDTGWHVDGTFLAHKFEAMLNPAGTWSSHS